MKKEKDFVLKCGDISIEERKLWWSVHAFSNIELENIKTKKENIRYNLLPVKQSMKNFYSPFSLLFILCTCQWSSIIQFTFYTSLSLHAIITNICNFQNLLVVHLLSCLNLIQSVPSLRSQLIIHNIFTTLIKHE